MPKIRLLLLYPLLHMKTARSWCEYLLASQEGLCSMELDS
jgi:hypothetical protein